MIERSSKIGKKGSVSICLESDSESLDGKLQEKDLLIVLRGELGYLEWLDVVTTKSNYKSNRREKRYPTCIKCQGDKFKRISA